MKKDIRPTKEQIELGEEWGWEDNELDRGYGVFQDDSGSFEYIARIDDMGVFDNDADAAKQAKRDGYSFLKLNKYEKEVVFKQYDLDPSTILDTPHNRQILKHFASKQKEQLPKIKYRNEKNNKKYRTKLTDAEYNAISKYTSHLKADSTFDIYDCGEEDKFKDWEEYRMVSLKTGLKWLWDCMVYSFAHDGMTQEEGKLIVDLLVEFEIITPEEAQYHLNMKEEDE